MGQDGAELHRAIDPARDQSYFLFATTREQLDYLRFPLGGMHKPEVRVHAERFGLVVADKPDSQDICFVPTGKYAEVVEKLRPGAIEPGDIVHVDGRVMGRHDGIIHYTIGQRKGLGIGGQKGDQETPSTSSAWTPPATASWSAPGLPRPRPRGGARGQLAGDRRRPDPAGTKVHVKLRSAQPAAAATAFPAADGGAEVILDEPQFGVAPGQACVFYQGDRVLGGGWIASAESRLAAA